MTRKVANAKFLVFLAGAQVFGVDKQTHHAGLATKLAACVSIAFLASTSIGYAFQSSKGDLAGAAVISYILLAIYVGK